MMSGFSDSLHYHGGEVFGCHERFRPLTGGGSDSYFRIGRVSRVNDSILGIVTAKNAKRHGLGKDFLTTKLHKTITKKKKKPIFV